MTRHQTAESESPAGVSAPTRLLVVDDEESVALTISEVLRREGFEVDTAASGAEAAVNIRRRTYELVLTDLHMEDGDGISVLAELRQYAPFTIPVVLTGFASVGSATAALRHGAFDYLVKPCSIEELKLTVRRGLEHRRLMVAEHEARRSLEVLNRELEQRVEERTAELQRLNRELSDANRAKDIFLATLSHELRTPLTPVLGWVNLLRTGGVQADAKLLAQGLDVIERNARLQARLIDDLLDISRIVSGKLRLEREAVDLRRVVEAAVETVRADAAAKRVELTVETPDSPVVVLGASVRLQQIVWNLLSNAVKFTPTGGRVTLRAFGHEGEARIEVTDTGIGITPDFLPFVFERFRQADGSTTRQHGGLGLGLAIVRALAELHGGWVGVESEGPNRGARFTFGVPRALAEPAAEAREVAAREEAATPAPQHAVLVVEDSAETLELLALLLSRRGYTVLAAGSAAEAISLAARQTPRLVISDIQMPEVDGHRLLAELRRLPGLERVPAIALSGYVLDEDRERALAAGFAVHLAKPVDPDQLFEVVRQLTA